ncbi:peptide ABC transporter ATP-binding protein [Methylobacterium radiotolerans]|nr:peptide ABC transporter ATP-binding protein [Methylobacterium radiotolerans]
MSLEPEALLTVRNLAVNFDTRQGVVAAVKGVDLTVRSGEVVCLVGESGSGKSVTGFSLMGLVDPPGRVTADALRFDGLDLMRASDREKDALRRQGHLHGVPGTHDRLESWPHRGRPDRRGDPHPRTGWPRTGLESGGGSLAAGGYPRTRAARQSLPARTSGGMRQRVMIAIACALRPKLIIADEPTTALDVTVQAQVLELLFALQAQTGAAVLFITHDLGVVAEIADRVVVMQAGRVVEEGDVRQIFERPRQAYTQALLAAVPDVDAPRDRARRLSQRSDTSAQGAPQ